ncbi:MAG: DUF6502 family protein [Cellvibrionaceae bacterium]
MLIDARNTIITAFRQLMRAVIRLALRNGVSCTEFGDLCKELYVEVAEKEYGINGRSTNMSRIALMTGINRHEVKRLLNQSSGQVEGKGTLQTPYKMANVLAAWYEDPRYLDKDGEPLAIPLEGDHPSFSALVQSVSVGGDIAAVTVLRELKRSQVVEEMATGQLKVLSRYYIPNYNVDPKAAPSLVNPNKITFGCSMLVDHVNTLFHNLYGKVGDSTRLELRAINHAIKTDDIPAFHEFTNQRSRQLLEDVDHWLEQHHAPGITDTQYAERMGVGVYVIQGENNTKSHSNV